MVLTSIIEESTRTDARMLDRAEGILVGLRRCTINDAFDEIVAASKRHRVPTLSMARALVALAENRGMETENTAGFAARYEWASLFEPSAGHR